MLFMRWGFNIGVKIIFVLIFFSSCNCKDYLRIIVVNVSYHNLPVSDVCFLVRIEQGNMANIIDTTVIDELTLSNNYTAEILPIDYKYDYLIYLQNSSHIDTISSFSVKKDRCNQIEDYSFYFNGQKIEENENIDVYL